MGSCVLCEMCSNEKDNSHNPKLVLLLTFWFNSFHFIRGILGTCLLTISSCLNLHIITMWFMTTTSIGSAPKYTGISFAKFNFFWNDSGIVWCQSQQKRTGLFWEVVSYVLMFTIYQLFAWWFRIHCDNYGRLHFHEGCFPVLCLWQINFSPVLVHAHLSSNNIVSSFMTFFGMDSYLLVRKALPLCMEIQLRF